MEKLRVAFVGRVLGGDYWGGERTIANHVFRSLRGFGLEPVAFHSYARRVARLRRRMTYLTGIDVDLLAVGHYLRALSHWNPDVVMGWYDDDTSLVYACQRLGIPIVLTEHVYWLQCPIQSLVFRGTTRFCAGPQQYCGTDVWKRQGDVARFLGPVFGKTIVSSFKKRLQRVNNCVKSIVACSFFVKSILERDGFKNVQVIHNGVAPSEYVCRTPEAAPTVLFSGQTSILKGFPDFLQMSEIVGKQFPDCKFLFTGGKRGNVHGIQGLGLVTTSQLRELFACSSVFVFPSIWQEPFGLVLLEAMASGKPVVAYRSGAVPEVVADGETGLIVERGNVQQLSQAVLGLLKNPDLAARMGEAGRRRVIRDFDIRTTATAYAKVIHEACD